jgi:hypothetical protein
MIQPHLQYGWQMNAQQALRLRRLGAVSRQDARQMRSLLGREVALPDSLLPACNLLYLAEVAPANRLPL